MSPTLKKYALFGLIVLAFIAGTFLPTRGRDADVDVTSTPFVWVSPSPTRVPANTPVGVSISDDPLKDRVIAAGRYLMRQQISNGELSYQVNFITGERAYSPLSLRLMGGTGALYTICRVGSDLQYCASGDLALKYYLKDLVSDPEKFKGACLYSEGSCQLGSAALTVDTIYKRWQATGSFNLDEWNLLDVAMELGYFIVSMRKPEGDFYHAFDPHVNGLADADYFAASFPAQSLMALLELYEMTGQKFWLKQAREVNAYMVTQRVTEDQWHAYAFNKLARLDSLSKSDIAYAKKIAQVIVDGEVRSLNPQNASLSSATKIEGLAALAQTFYLSGAEHEWLDPEIRAFILFVQARQIPNNNCSWELAENALRDFDGGVFNSCEEPTIRVDGLQNWINGVTTYLEYQAMIK